MQEKAFITSVDIDKYELNKSRGLNIDLKINSDLKYFFREAKKINYSKVIKKKWLQKSTGGIGKKYPIILNSYYKDKKNVNPYVFMDRLS